MTRNKIKQYDFQAATGLHAKDMVAIREKYFSDGEWWKEGVTIYYDMKAACRVKAILEAEKQQPATASDERDEEGQTGEQEQPEAEAQLPEVPVGEEAQQDAGNSGSDAGIVVPAEAEAETTLTARVIKRARNYRFVYANLDGERISVFCPKKGRREIVGKNVRVSKAVVDGETKYTLIP